MRSTVFPLFPSALVLALISALYGFVGSGPAMAEEKASPAPTENLYSQSYVSKDTPTVALQPDESGPKVYLGADKEKDYHRMLENGFDMLGYSSFDAPENVDPNQVMEQAKKVKADLVLVYTVLTANTPAAVRIQQLKEKARKAKKNPDAEAGDVNLDDDHALYSYFASYWVKLAPPVIGVHVTSAGEGQSGLKIMAVVKDSPAAKAALQDGDVLTRIGDVELTKPENLSQAAKRYAGQAVEIAWQRDGDANKATITLNKRP